MERTDRDVDAFLASIEGRPGEDIRRLDAAIVERMRGAERYLYEGKFWGGSDQQIVGYGVMDYENRSGENVEWFVVGLAAQKNYISMYVNAVKDGRYLLREYEKELGKAKVGSASISFGSLDDVDLDGLLALVEEAGRLS
ncbi:MAG TPA: DUF1801 domain-containing protein [Acidimicrobiia bacterium]